jgi:uncharacterized membrane protein YecN with MAPEG domain
MMIVPRYASLLGGLFVGLSWSALRLRRKYRVGVGDDDREDLRKALRAHANFAEYAPISILLLYFLEIHGGYSAWLIHALCSSLCVGRFVHAYGVRQVKEVYRYRVFGTALTLSSLSAACILLLGSSGM